MESSIELTEIKKTPNDVSQITRMSLFEISDQHVDLSAFIAVETITICGGSLTSLDIAHCTKLTSLTCDECYDLEDITFPPHSLKYLKCHFCQSLSEDMCIPSSLTSMHVVSADAEDCDFVPQLSKHTQLEHLAISYNKKLSKDLTHLKSLTSFEYYGTCTKWIPDLTPLKHSLVSLCLSDSFVSAFPNLDELAQLKKLEVFGFYKIKSISLRNRPPLLECIQVECCELLETVVLIGLPHLSNVSIKDCESLVLCVKEKQVIEVEENQDVLITQST